MTLSGRAGSIPAPGNTRLQSEALRITQSAINPIGRVGVSVRLIGRVVQGMSKYRTGLCTESSL